MSLMKAEHPPIYRDTNVPLSGVERNAIERTMVKRQLDAKYRLFMSMFEEGQVFSFKEICKRIYAQGEVPGFEEADAVASYLSYLLALGHILEVRKGYYKKDNITTSSQLFYDTDN